MVTCLELFRRLQNTRRMTKANDDMDFVFYLENSTRHFRSIGVPVVRIGQ